MPKKPKTILTEMKTATKKEMESYPNVEGLGLDQELDNAIEEIIDEKLNIRQKVYFEKLGSIPKRFKTSNNRQIVRVLGAAGQETRIPAPMLKVMTDPYLLATRTGFTNCAYTDPVLSPSIEKRGDAFYEAGFDFKLVLKSIYDPQTGDKLDPAVAEQKLLEQEQKYKGFLNVIRNWSDTISLELVMREAQVASFVQGRTCANITPGLGDLEEGMLPITVDIINTDDLGAPIVDVGLTHEIVGVKVSNIGKNVLRSDEMVYIVRRRWGLRKESKFYGSSALEPIQIISASLKRIYNYDIPQAVVASYISKVFFMVNDSSRGGATTYMRTLLTNYLTSGKIAFAVNQSVLDIKNVPINTDNQMLDTNEMKLAEAELATVGVPKSMLNREHNLNRSIATIEAIQFVKWVRNPDERLIANFFEDQLLNPLLAHLAQEKLADIPVKIEIVRNTPPGGELAEELKDVKEGNEIDKGFLDSDSIQESGATSTLGAASEKKNGKRLRLSAVNN